MSVSPAAFLRQPYAFLETQQRAFACFGLICRALRYDPLTSAVKRIVRRSQREETERFIAFRSHWGFQSGFCTPGESHQKSGVEGENRYYRRNHLAPPPKARSPDELNVFPLEESKRDEQRSSGNRSQSVGAGMCAEREHLLRLAEERFELASIHFPSVNTSGCVKVLTNFCSTPAPVGSEVQAKAYALEVEI